MRKRKIITVSEEEIRKILARAYNAHYKDVYLRHEDIEVSGLSGHCVVRPTYSAKIIIETESGERA